jgi:hypothetical protein
MSYAIISDASRNLWSNNAAYLFTVMSMPECPRSFDTERMSAFPLEASRLAKFDLRS